MASTLSAKSQQSLHNFTLPELKWPINNSSSSSSSSSNSAAPNNHFRFRAKLSESAQKTPLPDSLAPDDTRLDSATCDRSTNRGFLRPQPPSVKKAATVPPECSIENSADQLNSKALEAKAKIFVRFRAKSKCSEELAEAGDQREVAAKAEEPTEEAAPPKMWNLRPRKPPVAKPSNGGGPMRNGAMPLQGMKTRIQGRPELSRPHVVNEAKAVEKKRFSISLTKEEIEEDIFVMTGSKPARRPKKRARIIKKELNNLFPGLGLASIRPDSYRVPDTPAKG